MIEAQPAFNCGINWTISHRADQEARVIADRHYNRQKPGTPQFVPPGRCLVLLSTCKTALWVTSWPFAEYVKHAWPGAWMNSCFRNEGDKLSSALISEACAITRWYGLTHWQLDEPALGMVTFVDPKKTKAKELPGWCYRRAKFRQVGHTKGGLVALQLLPNRMPLPLGPVENKA